MLNTYHYSFTMMKATLVIVLGVLWHSGHSAKHLDSWDITVTSRNYRGCHSCLLVAGAIHVEEIEVTVNN